ncbi:hypothetical protein [Desulfotomaculum copahuensis]|uniref:Uncharacterized protein n=1 Tax=Desulfotomaculum copahuensis TaxID=1838280 RepID=A0A1B7LID3_9FIRM|nr:hypothetical protein [Desulfotomaculum copahuensis]OAT86326.1 hypothetical protein A6M21_03850 [Desulfotomaculum copahuensis]
MAKLDKWKLFAPLVIFLVTIAINVSGCSIATKASNSNQAKNSQAQTHNHDNESTSNNLIGYYTGKLDKKLLQVTRNNNKITAIHSKAYNLDIIIDYDKNQENYINSILFNHSPIGEIDFKGNYDSKPNSVENLGMSYDKKLLAIQLHYTEGVKVLVVNLKSGEKFILNDILKKLIGKDIETLWAYSWAPKEEKIAVAYGNTSTSNLAIYDFKTKLLSPIPVNSNLIGTAKILWNNNENQFDFISEYPSDNFFLYRYSFTDKKVVKIKKVPSTEIFTKYPDPNINLILKVSHP